MWLLFQLDGILFGFLSLSSSAVFQSAVVPGWTFNKYQHSSNPCPLAVLTQKFIAAPFKLADTMTRNHSLANRLREVLLNGK